MIKSAEALLAAATQARERAYAPYSNFTVGAALEAADGTVFTGANIENAAYGISLCAERVAVSAAVMAGHRDFAAIAICGPPGALTSPCGACRQVLCEFGTQIDVLYTGVQGVCRSTSGELLPASFGPKSLA